MRKKATFVLAMVCVMAAANAASADTIRGINMDFVTIGHAGNPGNAQVMNDGSTGYGAVSYNYRIGKYELTNAQWNAFTAAAGAPTGSPASAYDQSSSYTGAQQPTDYVSWYEAAQFCNYLTSSNKNLGAYQLGSNGSITVNRNAAISAYGTIYVIPTEDEWYKAAYYKLDGSGYSLYANGTNIAPVAGVNSNYAYGLAWSVGSGTMEQNGTFDMMGNILEWHENPIYGSVYGFLGGSTNDYLNTLSSSYRSYNGGPNSEEVNLGFRVASIPEPATLLLLGLGAAMLRKTKRVRRAICLVVVCVIAVANFASADTIRGISMDFVTIGNASNPVDTRAQANPYGCGAVGSNYRIGKYEVTNAQWNAFTAAAGAPTGNDGGYARSSVYYSAGAQQPANNVSWYEAAQFCNYLTSGNKSQGVYQFSGDNANPGNFLGINRDAAISSYGIAYFVPTEDEWYKAAYYKPNGSGYSLYANGTNIAPTAGVQSNYANGNYYIPPWNVGTGTQEQNGTFDMMGNVWEWNETICGYGGYENTPFYGIRGGCFVPYSNGDGLKSSDRGWVTRDTEYDILSFRVASDIIPEPCTLLLLGLGAAMLRKIK